MHSIISCVTGIIPNIKDLLFESLEWCYLKHEVVFIVIKYVFPLAQLARVTLLETHDYLETLPNDKAKKQHIALVEKGVKEQYTPIVKKLSRSQGRLLVKLIDRECGQTSYDMVKAFVGPLKAGFYQVFAGLFGNSLTKHYDPNGEDKYTERIVRMVESGQI